MCFDDAGRFDARPQDVLFCWHVVSGRYALQIAQITVHRRTAQVSLQHISEGYMTGRIYQEALLPQSDHAKRVEMLSTAAQQCRNKLYNQSATDRSNVDRANYRKWAHALPLPYRTSTEVDDQHHQTRRWNVDRRKYCQLSATSDGLVHHAERPPLSN